MPTSIERLVWPELRAFRPDLHRQPAVLRADAALRVLLHLTGDHKYLEYPNLYMCFPIEGTGNWYLVTHERLVEIVKENSNWLETKAWKENGHVRKPRPSTAVKSALEEFAYRACHGDRSFRECQTRSGL